MTTRNRPLGGWVRRASKSIRRWWRTEGRYRYGRRIDVGDLHRTTPFSDDFGADRGGAIDRVFVERFLESQSSSIRGLVLEIGDDAYTRRFGGGRVARADVFHVDPDVPNATWSGDLADAPQIPDGTYDCIVITQTLQFVFDVRGALATCHRILRPGGVLLVTVPGLSQLDDGPWSDSWYWSFTDRSLGRLLGERFDPSGVSLETFGNVYAASTFLFGLGVREVDRPLLDDHDRRYQVIVAASAKKADR